MSKDKPEVGDIVQETIKRGKYIRYFVLEKYYGMNMVYYMLLFPGQKDMDIRICSILVNEKELKKLKYLGKSTMKFGHLFEVQDD